MTLLWGIVIWRGYAIVARIIDRHARRDERSLAALEILERRYARGELTHEQFEEMRRRLTDSKALPG